MDGRNLPDRQIFDLKASLLDLRALLTPRSLKAVIEESGVDAYKEEMDRRRDAFRDCMLKLNPNLQQALAETTERFGSPQEYDTRVRRNSERYHAILEDTNVALPTLMETIHITMILGALRASVGQLLRTVKIMEEMARRGEL